jgi:hypothetical protein
MRADLDRLTVEGFGREWATYGQSAVAADELDRLFEEYFWIFPWTICQPAPSASTSAVGAGGGRRGSLRGSAGFTVLTRAPRLSRLPPGASSAT